PTGGRATISPRTPVWACGISPELGHRLRRRARKQVPAPARSEARLQWLGAHTPGDTDGHTLASTACSPDTEDTQSHVADPVDWPPISPEVLLVSRTTTAAVPRHDIELRVRIAGVTV